MSIATVSPANASGTECEHRGNYRRTLSDYRALDRALAAGDLIGARRAFGRLKEDSPWIAKALAERPLGFDNFHLRALKALGRYLLTGNLGGAKRAFQQFQ